VFILFIGAPYLLQVFGSNYVAESTTLLRLLSLSALPSIVVTLYLSMARVQRRMRAMVVVQGTLCLLVVTLGFWLLNRYGIEGLGWAWLISQTLVALLLLLTQLRAAWLTNLPLGSLWRLLAMPRRWWDSLNNRSRLADAAQLVQAVLPTVAAASDSWQVQNLIGSLNEMTVANLGLIDRPPAAILKLAHSDRAAANLRTQIEVLTCLRSDSRLAGLSTLMPRVLASGEIAGQFYLIEQTLPGLDGRSVLSDPAARTRLQLAAANAIARLHHATTSTTIVTPEMLKRWIDQPLQAIRRVAVAHDHGGEGVRAVDRLAAELQSSLTGRTVSVSWIHGDYMPGNVLVTADGSQLTGIIDWDLAAPEELPQLDLIHFLLSVRMLSAKREMGDVVRELLTLDKWTTPELDILIEAQAALSGEVIETRVLILLSWLRHIARNLTKSDRYSRNWLWLTKNIEGVLHHI
jgi:thiamine kinase-like enzyme